MALIDKIKSTKFRISDVKHWIFLSFCFFPFIDLFRLGTDTQPNALIFAFIILFFGIRTRFPQYLLLYVATLFFSLTLLAFVKLDFETMKGVINYLSIAVVPFAVFISLKKLNGLSYHFFRNVVVVWGLVALVQRFINTSFLTFLLSRSTGSGLHGRGVGSLAPEPTYYGSMVVLFFIIYIINFYERKDNKLVFFMLFQLIALSSSSTVLAVIAASTSLFIFFSFFRLKLKTISISIISILVIGLIAFISKPYWEQTRVYAIGRLVAENPELVLLDESISERVNHAFFPVVSMFDNFGIPHGYDRFQKYIEAKSTDSRYKSFFMLYNKDHYVKIMSSYGMVFFELGALGLLVPLCIFLSFRRFLKSDRFLFSFILLNFLLFTAMSFNNSLVLLVLGNILYLRSTLLNNRIQERTSKLYNIAEERFSS